MAEESKFSFNYLNVGQGSLQLIEEGDTTNIVIDCNLKGADEFVARYFGRRKVGQIDLLILSGKDADHSDADGLRSLKKRYDIKRLWHSDYEKAEETENWKEVQKIIDELEASGTIVEVPKAGHEYKLGSFELKVLSPHDDDSTSCNNASIVVRILAGKVSALFPGDCELDRWKNVTKYFSKYLPSNLLLIPHHGSSNGCDEDLLEAISPEYSVISAGEDNQYGHPDKEVLEAAIAHTQNDVYITHEQGSILFESDGETITKVVLDAGQDEDGKKAERIAGALMKKAPVFVSSRGVLGVSGLTSAARLRPTVSHGGDSADSEDTEVDRRTPRG
jgi:competence protein ComEC